MHILIMITLTEFLIQEDVEHFVNLNMRNKSEQLLILAVRRIKTETFYNLT